MEKLYSLEGASKITNTPIATIRLWIENGTVRRVVETETGQLLVSLWDVFINRPTVIAVYNAKSSQGNTTMSMLFADYLSQRGLKVLLLDLTTKANMSQNFIPFDNYVKNKNLYDFFTKNIPLEEVVHKINENIDFLPSDDRLEEYGITPLHFFRQKSEEMLLSFFKNYSLIIIDLPPGIRSTYIHFGLYLAEHVVIPVLPNPFSIRSMNRTMHTIEKGYSQNGSKKEKHIVLNMVENPSSSMHEIDIEKFKKELGDNVLSSVFPKLTDIQERIEKKPVQLDDLQSGEQLSRTQMVFHELLYRIYHRASE